MCVERLQSEGLHGCSGGHLLFDRNSLHHHKVRGDPHTCRSCRERVSEIKKKMSARGAWRCTCRRAMGHDEKCNLHPASFGDRRWPGKNKGVTESDAEFLAKRRKKQRADRHSGKHRETHIRMHWAQAGVSGPALLRPAGVGKGSRVLLFCCQLLLRKRLGPRPSTSHCCCRGVSGLALLRPASTSKGSRVLPFCDPLLLRGSWFGRRCKLMPKFW